MTVGLHPGDGASVAMPGGEARLDWDLSRRDRAALDRGVACTVGGPGHRLRRDRRALILEGPEGRLAIVRRKRRGRIVVEDARGTEVVRLEPGLKGTVSETARPEHVALALLVSSSGAALPARGGGALTPF
jgi:hypothetical protein